MAKQANGSVIVRSGESVVLVTACSNPEPKPGANFFPLTVDYREYTYSAGRFPGGFIKREGRMSEKETLTCRLIDRPIRPLFPEGYSNETQIIGLVLSADPTRDPSTLAIMGAGAALAISDIPFEHVMAGVRVGMVDGKLIANPTYEETKASKIGIVVAGTEGGIVMVESGAQQATEAEVLAAIEFGHDCCKKICKGIQELMKKAGKTKRAYTPPVINQELYDQISKSISAELKDAMNTQKYEKLESYSRVDAAKKKAMEGIPEEQIAEAKKLFDALKERIFRDEMLKERRRPDGRKFDEVRKIESKSACCRAPTARRCSPAARPRRWSPQRSAPRTTSSASSCWIPRKPPSASCCITTSRRSASAKWASCAARAAARSGTEHWPSAPLQPWFPTTRPSPTPCASSATSWNRTVRAPWHRCAARSLALMDAGVPIVFTVAGIAMGLVLEGKDYAVLTDIAGAEDHYGDMDFKVAGTKDGITALQMDIKVPNVTHAIMTEALEQARKARLHILDKMNAVIDTPRTTMSPYAPRIFTLQIPTDKIRELIGPGRQGDPRDRRSHRLQDRRRRRRQRQDLLLRRHRRRPLHPDGHRHLRGGRSGQDLPGQSGAHRRFRRVRRDLPRHRRPAAHLRDLGEPHQAGAR